MKTFAYMPDGIILQIMPPVMYTDEAIGWEEGDASRIGTEQPITERYTSGFLQDCMDITDESPMPEENWVYVDGSFHPPSPIVPDPAQVLAAARARRDYLLGYATLRINPLQDAVDIGEATPEDMALLKKWKQYRIAVSKVETLPGWPNEPQWPVPPVALEEGLSLAAEL